MGRHPNRRTQASERTPALPVSSAFAGPAPAQRRPAPGAAQGTSLRRAALLGHSVQRVAAGLIQPKLTLGPVADTYEREADSVAQQVMQHLSSPAPAPAGDSPDGAAPAPAAPAAATAQRATAPNPDEDVMTKPLAASVQRDDLDDDKVKMKPWAGAVQREADDDDVMTKRMPGAVQRAPSPDELQEKPLADTVRRAPSPDELQEKSIASVQRSVVGAEGGPIGSDVERSIESSRSGGGALDAGLRAQMEPAFGADFSGVRVHADSNAHQLNQSLQARAFTTGRDIFFRGGEYQPQSSAGQELIAHELTHVVQQGATPAAKKA